MILNYGKEEGWFSESCNCNHIWASCLFWSTIYHLSHFIYRFFLGFFTSESLKSGVGFIFCFWRVLQKKEGASLYLFVIVLYLLLSKRSGMHGELLLSYAISATFYGLKVFAIMRSGRAVNYLALFSRSWAKYGGDC